MKEIRSFILAACVLALWGVQARADSFIYNGFSNTAGLTMVGNTSTANTSDGTVLRVTPAAGGQAGAAYHTTPFTLGLGNTFSSQFHFRFTNPGGIDPADGITLVLAASPTGLGTGGGAIGYGGVPNSVAIEFDTYNNGPGDGYSSNHVAVDTNGSLNDLGLVNAYGVQSCDFSGGYAKPGCMSNGDLWTATIGYDGSNLNVTLKDAAGADFVALNNLPIDIASYLGTSSAYVGFTSGTGAGWENHDILDWKFADTATLPPSVPEPGTLALLGTGLAAVLRRRMRRA
jgi:hypothetical protein